MDTKVHTRLVCGWGINDVDYSVHKYKIVEGKYKVCWVCPYYSDWRQIIRRCFSEKDHKKYPTYIGCTVCEEWKYLSNFIKWVDSQPNRDWVNCEPDKDLLCMENKHYSPETVVYVSHKVNNFILDRRNVRGGLMLGTSPSGSIKNPYQSQCGNFYANGTSFLGYFPTELEAHLAWKAKKHEYACQLAELQNDPRVADALRQRYAPDKDWTNK